MKPPVRLAGTETDPRDPQYLAKRVLFEDLRGARRFARGKLLDLGCGNRPYAEIFRDRVDGYVGLDPDPRGSRPDVAGDAASLPFAGASFDTVLATQILEHVVDPGATLAEIRRVLRPGGRLILTAPQYWRLHEEPHDYLRFTRYGLDRLIRGAGLDPDEIRPEGGAFALAGQAIASTMERRRGRRFVIPLSNRLFRFLDERFPDLGDPMNYLVVASRKP